MRISPISAAAVLVGALTLTGCSQAPGEHAGSVAEEPAPSAGAAGSAGNRGGPPAGDVSAQAPGGVENVERAAVRVTAEIRDAKDATEDATRKIVDLTRGAAAAITEAGRDAVASVRDGAEDDEPK